MDLRLELLKFLHWYENEGRERYVTSDPSVIAEYLKSRSEKKEFYCKEYEKGGEMCKSQCPYCSTYPL